MDIGKRLRIVRQARGMTIAQVKEQTIPTYDRVETGKVDVSFLKLMKICKVLRIELWDLMAEEFVLKHNVDDEDVTFGKL